MSTEEQRKNGNIKKNKVIEMSNVYKKLGNYIRTEREMKLIKGDCLERLKDLSDNSIDSVVTDPPYGISLMGKKWDYDVPSVEIWKEALRVLKQGGHLLSFGGTRTYHRMVVNIEDAGFEIRDCIQWLYGSGFPKSLNIKEGDFKGWGTALKPANEPIVVARKPIEGTVAQNVAKYGTGAINIDGSRIEYEEKDLLERLAHRTKYKNGYGDENRGMYGGNSLLESKTKKQIAEVNTQGRWPANIIMDEEAAQTLDEQSGISASRFFYVAKASKSERNAGLEGMPLKENHRLGSGIGYGYGDGSGYGYG